MIDREGVGATGPESETGSAGRKPYEEPRLIEYGDVAELTKQVGGPGEGYSIVVL
jgi:hypothetical protein